MQQENNTTKITQRVRQGLDTGAEWVAHRKHPIDIATEKTLKLNGISHESAARLVRQQASFIEGSVDAAARRLRTAAQADSLRNLIDGQIKMLPETRDRIVDDVRKTFEILTDTREDLGQLFRETLTDLRADTKKENFENAVDKVANAAKNAGDKVEDAADSVSKSAKGLGDKVEETVSH